MVRSVEMDWRLLALSKKTEGDKREDETVRSGAILGEPWKRDEI